MVVDADRRPSGGVDRRHAKGVVTIPLNRIAASISQQRHTAFVVLLREIRVPLAVGTNGDTLQDFVDPFPIHVNSGERPARVKLQDRFLPVV